MMYIGSTNSHKESDNKNTILCHACDEHVHVMLMYVYCFNYRPIGVVHYS